MIIGIGNDIIDIRRIEGTLARFGDRFVSRVFTEIERAKSERRAERAASYAKRFAAKEACAKALGTGLRHGVYWRDMGVVNLPSGRPTLTLTGGAAAHLERLVPWGGPWTHPGNAAAHVKASLVGHALVLAVEEGEIQLGQWQGIFLCEFHGPRARTVRLSIQAYAE